jgi:hypothetical protein
MHEFQSPFRRLKNDRLLTDGYATGIVLLSWGSRVQISQSISTGLMVSEGFSHAACFERTIF